MSRRRCLPSRPRCGRGFPPLGFSWGALLGAAGAFDAGFAFSSREGQGSGVGILQAFLFRSGAALSSVPTAQFRSSRERILLRLTTSVHTSRGEGPNSLPASHEKPSKMSVFNI